MSRHIFPAPVTWAEHKTNWLNCHGCDLCETRTKVSLFRYLTTNTPETFTMKERLSPSANKRPRCDILGIGEAPGESEDVKGNPFTGPAGKKLDEIVRDAFRIYLDRHSEARQPIFGLTNIVGCWPYDHETRQPNKTEIEACRPRLDELIASVEPSWIICFGNVAKAAFPGGFQHAMTNLPTLGGISHLQHPSSLLRIDNPARRSTEIAIYRTEIASILTQWAEFAVKREVSSRRSTSKATA